MKSPDVTQMSSASGAIETVLVYAIYFLEGQREAQMLMLRLFTAGRE